MPYINVRRCVNCNKKLSDYEVMYSSGRCPKCGYKSKRARTIVDTTESADFVSTPNIVRRYGWGFLIGCLIGFSIVLIAKLLAGTLSAIMTTLK